MSPTVFREGEFRFYFFSREESRMHVHVSHPDGEAKLGQAERLVQSRQQEIINAWNDRFGR